MRPSSVQRTLCWGDVAGIRTDSMPAGADMAWASFPCQDLSLAGWRKGMRAERSGTYWEFWRLMRDSLGEGDRPPLIVIENVVGMLYGKDFPILCESLAALGMQFGTLVIDARQFLPQSRPRVFVVAVDSRVDCSLLVNEEVDEAVPWFTKAVKSAHTKDSGDAERFVALVEAARALLYHPSSRGHHRRESHERRVARAQGDEASLGNDDRREFGENRTRYWARTICGLHLQEDTPRCSES